MEEKWFFAGCMNIERAIKRYRKCWRNPVRLGSAASDVSRPLTFAADINSFTGYGLHAIQIIRDLIGMGVQVAVRPTSCNESFGALIPADIRALFVLESSFAEWELLLHPPNFPPTSGKKTAYFTMWEASRLPPNGVSVLNKAEIVIVPNVWNATCFSACGVNAPIRVVPLGMNTEVYRYRPKKQHGPFVFGAAGRMAHGGVRKGLNEVIDLFLKAFPNEPDVRLHIKCHPDCPLAEITDERIVAVPLHLSDAELADWYAGLDCFVSAARAEGWGLMQMQAMATGRALISVNFGGISEFFERGTGYEVEYRLRGARDFYANLGVWAEPVDKSFIEAMRQAYENPSECCRFGVAAAKSVKNLSWHRANKALAVVLKETGAI